METLVFGVFGLIIGSFLNVLILRFGIRSLSGRSACTSCGRTIPWYDLIPVISWALLFGRCRVCKAPISIQYPLVEAATAILFALIGTAPLPLHARLLALLVAAIFVAIAVYDLHHTIIPDSWVYPVAALALLSSLVGNFETGGIGGLPLVILAGPLVALPLFLFWYVSRGTWMGLGDAKLALAIGWLLGIWSGFSALFFAFMLGALVALPMLFFSSPLWRRIVTRFTPTTASQRTLWGFTMRSEVPFGPFLIASCFLVWIFQMYGIPLPLFS